MPVNRVKVWVAVSRSASLRLISTRFVNDVSCAKAVTAMTHAQATIHILFFIRFQSIILFLLDEAPPLWPGWGREDY